MKLSLAGIKFRESWQPEGFVLPAFDIPEVNSRTKESPSWLHFGAGNIFRALPAYALQRLLDKGAWDRGVIACEAFDGELIDKAYTPYNNLSILCILKSDGTVDKRVIASVTEALRPDGAHTPDRARVMEIFRAPSLQMVSFTITEKGYNIPPGDPMDTPDSSLGTLGLACAGLYERFSRGLKGISMVSLDNCSHNGDRLREAILTIAGRWIQRGHVPSAFADYLAGPHGQTAFPLTMIDKITPRPDLTVRDMLTATRYEDAEPFMTGRGTYTASFVNSEEAEYLVIEDRFPSGRPPLELAGVYFTDRETVNRAERMKVCACLNPLHTALAVLGCLLGYDKIHAEMRDKDLNAFVRRLAFREGMPVVMSPGIISPEAFAREVIETRFPNPFMPDTPQRIAADTSQKLPVRFGETLKAYRERPDLDIRSLVCIPFVFAAWLRYLLGINDAGETYTPSPDPLLVELQKSLSHARPGAGEDYTTTLLPILRRAELFGMDLAAAGIADKVTGYFNEMTEGPGSVRAALGRLLAAG
jgi:fructuronate reductase